MTSEKRSAEVSTISGNTIRLIVDHHSNGSPAATQRATTVGHKLDQSLDLNGDDEEDQFTKISLNELIQRTLADSSSDIGRQMRMYLADGEDIPKRLIYTALKQALDHVHSTKPVLIVDRRLTLPEHHDRLITSSSTQTEGDHARKVSSGIVALGIPNELASSKPNGLHLPSMIEDVQHRKSESKMSRLATILKRALIPPDEPAPPMEEKPEEDKSNFLVKYFKKMRGGQKRPPYERPLEALQSLLVSFTGMLALTVIDFFILTDTEYTLVIGSFGATAVLVFCAIKSPLAQPRNVLGGHFLAAIIGTAFQLLLGTRLPWLAAALAVSVSIAVMSLTNTVHPPAGATALIAVYSNDKIHKIGFMYVLTPVMGGAGILLVVAILGNNLFPSRRYPQYWI